MKEDMKKTGGKAADVTEVDETVQKRKLKRRRERVSIIEQSRIMSIPNKDDSYVYRLVTDENEKIEQKLKAGYEIVDKSGEDLSIDGRLQDPSWRQSAASQSVGGGLIGYLMRIPREWYEEDKAKKRERLDEKTAMLKNKAIAGINQSQVYGEISVEA
jgi:hypothetical protein